ncbi:MAG: hypothetical protein N3F63_02495 [Thermoplasmata archaeon]|nr:hypothetical protein [Thermoplasmata archaeon]
MVEYKYEKMKKELPFLEQIKVVDTKLEDFDGGKRVTFKEKVLSCLPQPEDREIEYDGECGIKEENLLYLLHPKCPQCESTHIVHNGTNKRKLRTPGGMKDFIIQRYLCPRCKCCFQPSLLSLKKTLNTSRRQNVK